MNNACEVHHPLSPGLALPEVLAETVYFMANQGFHALLQNVELNFSKSGTRERMNWMLQKLS